MYGPIHTSCCTACCPESQLVVEEKCANFYVPTGGQIETVWTDPEFHRVSVSFFVESDSNQTTFTVTTDTGPEVVTVNPGNTTVETFEKANMITVTSAEATPAHGRVCLTVYRKIRA